MKQQGLFVKTKEGNPDVPEFLPLKTRKPWYVEKKYVRTKSQVDENKRLAEIKRWRRCERNLKLKVKK